MMHVNLFTSQDGLPGSSPHAHHQSNSQLKSPCISLDSQLAEDCRELNRDLLSSLTAKPNVSNNNDTGFPKDIFTITQGRSDNLFFKNVFLTNTKY